MPGQATDAQGRRVFDNRELDWHSTMNVSFIEGGEAINQVKERCFAYISCEDANALPPLSSIYQRMGRRGASIRLRAAYLMA